MSVSSFGIKVTLVSQNVLRYVPSSSVFFGRVWEELVFFKYLVELSDEIGFGLFFVGRFL